MTRGQKAVGVSSRSTGMGRLFRVARCAGKALMRSGGLGSGGRGSRRLRNTRRCALTASRENGPLVTAQFSLVR